jgi:hypothetical protein
MSAAGIPSPFNGTSRSDAGIYGRRGVAAGEELIAEYWITNSASPANYGRRNGEVDHRFGSEEQMVVTAILLLLEEN